MIVTALPSLIVLAALPGAALPGAAPPDPTRPDPTGRIDFSVSFDACLGGR